MLATAPLVVVGTASASPAAGTSHSPEKRSHNSDSNHGKSSTHGSDDSDDRDSDYRDIDLGDSDDNDSDNDSDDDYSSTARHRADAGSRRARAAITRPVTSSRSRSSSQSSSTRSTDAQWDRVADCESSGNWSANTGNGYKGGLQFSDSTWRAHGGSAYAPSADKASREEQIAIAKQVQREQGSRAWPSCGRRLGGT